MLNFTCVKITFLQFFHFQFFSNLVIEIIDYANELNTNELSIKKYWTHCFADSKNHNFLKI